MGKANRTLENLDMTERESLRSVTAISPAPPVHAVSSGRAEENLGPYESRTTCRICGSPDVRPILSLGNMPLTAAFRREDDLSQPEIVFPLTLIFCPCCSLAQLRETVPPEMLFRRDYPYYSSFLPALVQHSKDNASDLIASRRLGASSLVVELASNDGYLLKHFVERGVPVLGIDPAEGQARAAKKLGVPTLCEFFSDDVAKRLVRQGRTADVVIGNNVLAHVAALHGFVEGIGMLLKDGGVAVLEVPYVRDLVDRCEFDTIYHEHLCYFSLTALDHLFRKHSLFINHVQRLSIHGGSLRIYAEKKEAPARSVQDMLSAEEIDRVNRVDYYSGFARRVEGIRTTLRDLLLNLKTRGARIAAYGAAAKGVVLLNYTGIGGDLIDFVVDRNTHKHGFYMPGKRIEILGPEALLTRMPDDVLLLTWNFADEILQQQTEYRMRGGQFIVPVPSPHVV
jgi:SAM-dependent methyltransferase